MSQVDSGTMKLVDEKKALADASNLRKQRKNFSGFEDSQKAIDEMKAQLSTLKKGLENPEAKALSDKYLSIQKELDAIKAEQDEVFKNIKSLRDERSKAHAEQQKAWTRLREIKDTYYKSRKAWKAYEDELYRARAERQKAYREQMERERRKKVADKKLEEASSPAFTDEILTAEGLIRHLDPTYDLAAHGLGSAKQDSSATFRAEVGRTVDGSGLKGVALKKKEDREDDYFVGTGGKKGKKGKKANGAAAQPDKFNLALGVIEDFSRLKVDPPMAQADVPSVIEKLVEKLKYWKENQQAETEKVCCIIAFFSGRGCKVLTSSFCRTSRRRKRRSSVSRKKILRLPPMVPPILLRQNPLPRRMALLKPLRSSRRPLLRTLSKSPNLRTIYDI